MLLLAARVAAVLRMLFAVRGRKERNNEKKGSVDLIAELGGGIYTSMGLGPV